MGAAQSSGPGAAGSEVVLEYPLLVEDTEEHAGRRKHVTIEYHPRSSVGFQLWPAAFALADYVEQELLLPLWVSSRTRSANSATSSSSNNCDLDAVEIEGLEDHKAVLEAEDKSTCCSERDDVERKLRSQSESPELASSGAGPAGPRPPALLGGPTTIGSHDCSTSKATTSSSAASTEDTDTARSSSSRCPADGAANPNARSSGSKSSSSSSGPRSPPPLKILELGCGVTALVSQVCAAYGHDVVASDDLDVVQQMYGNLALNEMRVKAMAANWYSEHEVKAVLGRRQVDFILMSEVVYFPALFRPLLETLTLILDSNRRIKARSAAASKTERNRNENPGSRNRSSSTISSADTASSVSGDSADVDTGEPIVLWAN